MMSGKTTVGHLLSKLTGLPFADLDDLVVPGMTPQQIFAEYGEPYFRQKEAEALAKAVDAPKTMILALGGGTPMREENRETLKRCHVIWLRASLEKSVFAMADKEGRPLLKNKSREEIEQLYALREPIYSSVADCIVDVDDFTPDGVADILVRHLGHLAILP